MFTTGTWKNGCVSHGRGTQVPLRRLNEPGCYVCNSSGHMLRVPREAIDPGRSAVLAISAPQASLVTKISNDPFIAIARARMLAANADLNVNF